MEGESNGMEGGQPQCRAGCGYFGSPATDGLCSLCYKEAVKKKQQPPNSSSGSSLKVPSPQRMTPNAISSNTIATASAPTPKPIEESLDGENTECPISSAAETEKESQDGCSVSAESSSSTAPEKKKSNRCQTCRKKVGLTGFECRCGGLFCSIHRYSDKHNCTFNYRELGAEEIRKNNPVVAAEKIHKI